MKANPKTVVLYLGMIGFIVIAFSAISSYGSTHLQAPKSLGGQYTLDGLTATGCFSEPPLLILGQSGSYLGADIVPADASKKLLTRALKGNGLLHGRIENGQMQLAGKTALGSCKGAQAVAVTASSTASPGEGEMVLEGRTFPMVLREATGQ